MVRVIKRDCSEVDFDKNKISTAILKAMKNGSGIVKPKIAESIADEIEEECKDREEIDISEIEAMVFDKLITKKQRLTARAYEGYRSTREFQRENENTVDEEILGIVEANNEEWKDENANKNPALNPTIRDYIAGSVSKDATKRFLLSPEIIQSHSEGIIHFHDSDYFIQHMHNCGLVNLEDMLQNGTVISETMIEKPHSFSTACTVTTQIIAQVASSQYGGQSISLAHLAPFVDISRQKIREEVEHELVDIVDTVPMTYRYYHEVIRGGAPKNAPSYIAPEKEETSNKQTSAQRWVCDVCGYVYEGDLTQEPDDYTCPLCGVNKTHFIKETKEETKMAETERWVCDVCGYVYEGDLTQEPDDYVCPLCGVDKSHFTKE